MAGPDAVVLCSHNRHKADELAVLLAPIAVEPLPARAPVPDETATDFVGNARIKAVAGAALLPGRWVVADDSGLVVEALDGAPGVRSARFAGDDATDAQNTVHLLGALDVLGARRPEQRRAHFVCVLLALGPDGREVVAQGRVSGRIADAPSGDGGFGYDPVFVPDGHDASYAELPADVKAATSHRAVAAAQLRRLLA